MDNYAISLARKNYDPDAKKQDVIIYSRSTACTCMQLKELIGLGLIVYDT